MVHHRFLLVTYPAQGHINPALQFAKRIIATGNAHVTLAVTVHLYRRMIMKTTIPGLSLIPFSDGYDDGFNAIASKDANKLYNANLKHRGSHFITNLILSRLQEGHPFTCLIHTLLVPWAPRVARGFNLPTAQLWIESATVLGILYYYFHGYSDYINNKTITNSRNSIALPRFPFFLSPRDIPSFLVASNPSLFSFVFSLFEEEIRELDVETNPTVLVNTFEALEPEALRAVDNINMIPIGPLIPSNDDSYGGDLFQASNDYIEWLDLKPKLSVVYVSFGSYLVLSKCQMEEIARALLDCGHPFLWVIREKEKEEEMSCRKELELKGKIVKWCSQVEVLSHSSLGCFLTHCGWNSTMESLVSGVPMVAFPQWTDQKTNAKLIEDVWKTGVRVDDHQVNGDGIVEGEEIRKCLELVMGNGEKAKELRRNSMKWKGLAMEAAKESGPSEKNLMAFLDDVDKSMQAYS